MGIQLTAAENGVILTNETNGKRVYIFGEDKDLQSALQLQALLEDVLHAFAFRHNATNQDKYNVVVKVEHGSEYACKDKNCIICRIK